MQGTNKLQNAIGLAMRAGRCVTGDFAVEKLLKKNGACLILLDADASENLQKKYRDACAFRKLQLLLVQSVGAAIGKPERKVLAITDQNFMKLILSAANASDEER